MNLSSYERICYHYDMGKPFLWEKISSKTQKEILREVEICLQENRNQLRIATVNLEYIFEARKNDTFQKSLERADFWLCDSIGVYLYRKLFGKKIYRIPGVDISWKILGIAQQQRKTVCFATRRDGLSSWEELRKVIKKTLPQLLFSGREFSLKEKWEFPRDILESDVVLCNFGIPEQEYFLEKLQKERKNGIFLGGGRGV